MTSVSVVIPALNEEEYLPPLLQSIGAQERPPQEVIVVDAGSSDRTMEIAGEAGARVLEGGSHPGESRNLGARHAEGEWLLFLDADVRLAPDALDRAMRAVEERGLDAASCWFVPDRRTVALRLNHWLSAQYFRLASAVGWAHSIGAFLLVRRALHERVGGFDNSVRVAEDQDYVLRLARAGRYAFLRRPEVVIAARRFEQEGVFRQSLKWLAIEAHRIFLGEIRGEYFGYFG